MVRGLRSRRGAVEHGGDGGGHGARFFDEMPSELIHKG